MQKRQPLVTVLGHVDHGKTTLLDAIRKTAVASGEAGGITQRIGASVVNGITFIDTPGHAAFANMRGTGAGVADIIILVVASDDGIKPQTREALEIIKVADTPYIVAATKIDVPGVNPERVRGELEKEGILFEGRGGQVPFLPLSAKTGQGLDSLLETIKLLAEVHETSGDLNAPLEAVVIESFKDNRGPVANIVIRNGTLKIGQEVTIANLGGKVRGIFNEEGKGIGEVLPGFPAQVIGLTKIEDGVRRKVLGDARRLGEDELPVIIKASNAGALEAIIASLPEKVVVVEKGLGDVTGSDVLTAKTGNARIFAFETKIPKEVAKLAEADEIVIKRFDIVYELLQEVEEILKGDKVQILGRAKILASFPFDNKKVAGGKVIEGKITKGDTVTLLRNEKEVGKAKIISLKKQKVETSSVGQNEEFGAIFEPQLDFSLGDMIVSSR